MTSFTRHGRRKKKRAKQGPPSAALPDKVSFTSDDLVKLTGCLPKTLYLWRRRGVLPRVPSKGPRTRYDRAQARRALAIARAGLQAAELPRFEEMIPFILDEAPPARPPAAGPQTAADGPKPVADLGAQLSQAPRPAGSAPAADPDAPLGGRAWQHIELLPGLEIHLVADAPPFLRSVVRDLALRFGRTL